MLAVGSFIINFFMVCRGRSKADNHPPQTGGLIRVRRTSSQHGVALQTHQQQPRLVQCPELWCPCQVRCSLFVILSPAHKAWSLRGDHLLIELWDRDLMSSKDAMGSILVPVAQASKGMDTSTSSAAVSMSQTVTQSQSQSQSTSQPVQAQAQAQRNHSCRVKA